MIALKTFKQIPKGIYSTHVWGPGNHFCFIPGVQLRGFAAYKWKALEVSERGLWPVSRRFMRARVDRGMSHMAVLTNWGSMS